MRLLGTKWLAQHSWGFATYFIGTKIYWGGVRATNAVFSTFC